MVMSVTINAEVAKTFFTHKGNNIHVCVCGRERKQLPKKGYTNLIRHITVDYPEWQQEISQKKQNTLSFAKTNKKGNIIHS